MDRKCICLAVLSIAFGMAVFAGGGKDKEVAALPPAALDGTVWAGPLGDDWITLAFRADDGNHGQDAVIQSASPVNGETAPVEYVYDKNARTGSLTSGDADNPAGAFSLGGDGKTIIFADFMGSGSRLILQKLLPEAGNTFTLIDPLPGDLKNTVWVSEGFRVNDWITLIFKGQGDTEGSVEFSHVADNSQNTRAYTYDAAKKVGIISSVSRDFEIRQNNAELELRNFYGHGTPVNFKRVR
jgi:hypothetical protein